MGLTDGPHEHIGNDQSGGEGMAIDVRKSSRTLIE
jgi:hypothetical protein